MSIDKTLKSKGRLSRSRNVLKREERIAHLQSEDRWNDESTALGMAKLRIIKMVVGKKKKKKAEDGDKKDDKKKAAKKK